MKKFKRLIEKRIISEQKYDGKLLHLYQDTVQLANGEYSTREYTHHVGGVCIVPLMPNGDVFVEKQFRYPVNRVMTEIPAGKLDFPEEDRLVAAKRELAEETGITADEWICLGDYLPAAAYTDEVTTMYLAWGLHFGEQNLDDDELINVEAMPIKELIDMIMDGKICDGKTISALFKTAKMLQLL